MESPLPTFSDSANLDFHFLYPTSSSYTHCTSGFLKVEAAVEAAVGAAPLRAPAWVAGAAAAPAACPLDPGPAAVAATAAPRDL